MSPAPRSYWRGVSDTQLADARDEYRRRVDEGPPSDAAVDLERVAADIDDDLARRAAEREAAAEAGVA